MLSRVARTANVAYAFVMSGIMAFVMSAFMTALNAGVDRAFPALWLRNDLAAWAIAFPLATLLAPVVGRLVDRWESAR